jgi:ZIP family zinc transporter
MGMATKAAIALALCTVLSLALLLLTMTVDFSGFAHSSNSSNIISLESGQHLEGEDQAKHSSDWDLKVSALARSLLAGLSTSLGAGAVMLPSSTPTAAHMAFALALAGGVMVTVSFFELWLPRLWEPGWRFQAIVFSALGAMAFLGLSKLVPEPDYSQELDVELGAEKSVQEHRKGKQWRLAMVMMLALTAHNFPEGLAVAISSMESERLGFVVMAAIAVHNVPEGIAIAMPVFDASKSRMRALQMATLSGLAEPLGALVALTMLPPDMLRGRGMDALLCIVGGIMTCVAFIELFPEARAQCESKSAVAGMLTGVAIMLLTMSLA